MAEIPASSVQAAFHGVPIVGIPVFGDQPDNVMKSVNRGLGVTIQPGKITREGLRAAVEQVISADGYAQAAARISVRMRAHRVSPVEKAAGPRLMTVLMCCCIPK